MSVIKGILKRYFPNLYIKKYNNIDKLYNVEKDADSLNFENLYLNSFTTTLVDEITIEERYNMNYRPLGICDLFISNKYLIEDSSNDIILVDSFYNNKGDNYLLYTNVDGKIYHAEYTIKGDKNLIIFQRNNEGVTIKDKKGYHKTFTSYYHRNVYECDNFLERILDLRKDCKNVILEGYKIFNEYSCNKYQGL